MNGRSHFLVNTALRPYHSGRKVKGFLPQNQQKKKSCKATWSLLPARWEVHWGKVGVDMLVVLFHAMTAQSYCTKALGRRRGHTGTRVVTARAVTLFWLHTLNSGTHVSAEIPSLQHFSLFSVQLLCFYCSIPLTYTFTLSGKSRVRMVADWYCNSVLGQLLLFRRV